MVLILSPPWDISSHIVFCAENLSCSWDQNIL